MRNHLFFLLIASLGSLPTPCAFADEGLHVMYTYRGSLGSILSRYSASGQGKIREEFIDPDDIKSALLAAMDTDAMPDAVITPADHVGLYNFMGYSEIDPSVFKTDIPQHILDTAISDGKVYGVPIIQGNHLVLFYNKALVAEPARDWQTLLGQKPQLEAQGRQSIAWDYEEPFWFLPFLGAFGGWPLQDDKVELNTPAMVAALKFYKSFYDQGLSSYPCTYQCSVEAFKREELAYTINGEWEGRSFFMALGDKLGVSQLPLVGTKPMQAGFSTQVIAFPKNSLNGSKRAALIKLVDYLQSPATQKQLWQQTGAIPVEPSAFDYAQKNSTGYLNTIIVLMAEAKPLPADQAMSFIWHSIKSGLASHREGALDAEAAAAQMQYLVERHLRNAKRQAKPRKR